MVNKPHQSPASGQSSRLIALGIIMSAHGIRGQVKIRSFTADAHDITAYGPLRDASGRQYNITVTGGTKDTLIATVEGVDSRNEAELLGNTELFVPRSAFPKPSNNEYYHEDLLGMALVSESGEPYGTITGVHNFGAGNLISLRQTSGEEEFLPFTRKTFPKIDLEKGIVVIVPPEITPDTPDA